MRNFVKGLFATVLASSIVMSSFAVVNAANPDTTVSVIDDTKKGSITLVKYADPDGNWIEAHGLDSDSLPDALPIKGIEFTEYKVGDVGTFLLDGEIGTYYTNLTDEFVEYFTPYGLVADKVDGTQNYYTAKTLQDTLELANANQAGVEQFVVTNGTKFDETDADGKTSKSELDLGLYLIAETDTQNAKVDGNYLTGDDTYIHLSGLDSQNTDMSTVTLNGDDGDVYDDVDATSCTIASKTKPYFISVPTTNTATITIDDVEYAPGTVWMYDITSYPKNSITDVTKMIIDQDDEKTLRAYEDYEIGQTVNQVIFTGVQPLRDGKKHLYYRIKDTMTLGLDFKELISVTYGARTKNPTTTDDFEGYDEFVSEDYNLTVAEDLHSFEVEFTETGLAKLDALTTDSLVVVRFDATLNKDAIIGPKVLIEGEAQQNMNQPTLRWQNTGEPVYDIEGNKVYVFTYKIDVTKDGLDDLTKATFRVQKATKKIADDATETNNEDGDLMPDGTDLYLVEEKAGVYHLFDNSRDNEEDKTNRIHPDAEGKLYVKGVDSEQYVIIEVATEKGSNLLTHGFELVVTAPDKGTASLEDPKKDSHRDGNITAEAVTSDSAGVITKRIPLLTESGVVYITIHNNDVVALHTGGNGVAWYYIISSLMLIGVVGFIVYKKKRNVE